MNIRLKQLRLARGLTLESLAAEMGGIVTKQALSKYERGIARPGPLVSAKLAAALGIKAMYLWAEPTVHIEFVAYRKGSRLLKRDQEKARSLVTITLEQRVRLQELTGRTKEIGTPVRQFKVENLDDTECAAEALRSQWNLGLDPIASVVAMMEDNLIHVLEIEADEKFDGISAVARGPDGRPIATAVVTRSGVPGERQRFSLCHELGHLAMDIPEDLDEEKAAHRFAGAFLAPKETVFREVGERRSSLQLAELLPVKQYFGMSLQALLYRMHDLEIINDSCYTQCWRQISKLRWRKSEPFAIHCERPQWLEKSVLRGLAEGLLTYEEARTLLSDTSILEKPTTTAERRAFMKLPLDERRRALEKQAKALLHHYQEDTTREKLQTGDIVDY